MCAWPYRASNIFLYIFRRPGCREPSIAVHGNFGAKPAYIVCLAVFAFLSIFGIFLGQNTIRFTFSRPLPISVLRAYGL